VQQCGEAKDAPGSDEAAWVLSSLGFGLRQQHVQAVGGLGAAQLFAHGLVAQQARDTRQRLQVIGAGRFRGQQQEDQIHRMFVDSIEIDGLFQAREHAIEAFEVRQLAVRNGNAVADTRGAETLAFQQRFLLVALRPATTPSGFSKSLISITQPMCRTNHGSAGIKG